MGGGMLTDRRGFVAGLLGLLGLRAAASPAGGGRISDDGTMAEPVHGLTRIVPDGTLVKGLASIDMDRLIVTTERGVSVYIMDGVGRIRPVYGYSRTTYPKLKSGGR